LERVVSASTQVRPGCARAQRSSADSASLANPWRRASAATAQPMLTAPVSSGGPKKPTSPITR
jgi:hypothetical protein